mmetsp:Transcript_35288/g.109940  ORF Transcript_35288/g.109940 Transcript_35288/m.109940 type:complete len:409 (-) Transcript_35288:105-1331(-)|eukprot:CAMPEP_0204563802 /NCGR_PEP_ID=MMETSP0661-20131031/34525_1 /ASSEMBLY_ACC=CAM_ASM_000606 /TAXON_ID=109239 /ORGANISM="Alexandrium margalefi, Strain AMGDE01CS-322" /LENGTH=408 /DNA_ID=CAMNT_0051571393 /DNA_START=78 /DNA_END=1304 /DNA_ORIENTATION=-
MGQRQRFLVPCAVAFSVIAALLAAACTQESPVHPRPTAILVGLVAAAVAVGLRVLRRPRDTLMELASSIQGEPPAEILERVQRLAAKRAAARPPPTQEEELASLDVTPAPCFDLEDPAWLGHLEREGFAVVTGVAGASEIARGEELLWDFLEEKTSWRRGNPETWTDQAYERVGSVQNGLLNDQGAGQSDFLWYIRTRPRVKRAFAKIWDTEELLVSYDGANVFRPWHWGFKKTVCGWWHVDQGAGKRGRHCVQGFVSLFPANGTTGGLTVVPGSHLRHEEVTQDMANPNKDYCTVQPYEPVLQEMSKKLVSCQPGDLVLWDSRTIHANSPAPQPPTAPGDRLLRAVAYVCMTPKRFATQDVRANRRVAYEHRVATTHWPHELVLGSQDEKPPRSLAEAPPEVSDLVG